jgi:hypothetical protein
MIFVKDFVGRWVRNGRLIYFDYIKLILGGAFKKQIIFTAQDTSNIPHFWCVIKFPLP